MSRRHIPTQHLTESPPPGLTGVRQTSAISNLIQLIQYTSAFFKALAVDYDVIDLTSSAKTSFKCRQILENHKSSTAQISKTANQVLYRHAFSIWAKNENAEDYELVTFQSAFLVTETFYLLKFSLSQVVSGNILYDVSSIFCGESL